MRMASAIFSRGNWTFTVHGNRVYDRVSGPTHRLDVSIHGSGDAAARSLPHGLVGQSFASPASRSGHYSAPPVARVSSIASCGKV